MVSLEDTILRIANVLHMKLLMCCLKIIRVVMLLSRLIFPKLLTPFVEVSCYRCYITLVLTTLLSIEFMLSCNIIFFLLGSIIIWFAIFIVGGVSIKEILCLSYFYV